MSPELMKLVDKSDNVFEAMLAAMIYLMVEFIMSAAEVVMDIADV